MASCFDSFPHAPDRRERPAMSKLPWAASKWRHPQASCSLLFPSSSDSPHMGSVHAQPLLLSPHPFPSADEGGRGCPKPAHPHVFGSCCYRQFSQPLNPAAFASFRYTILLNISPEFSTPFPSRGGAWVSTLGCELCLETCF